MPSKFPDYNSIYEQVISEKGLAELGDDPNKFKKIEEDISTFINVFEKQNKANQLLVHELSLSQLYKNTLDFIIDIINEVIDLFNSKVKYSNAEFQIRISNIFFEKNRQFYFGLVLLLVGIILILFYD
jgi:argonaute-like protein implicated in RNA metabolism and viral defense